MVDETPNIIKVKDFSSANSKNNFISASIIIYYVPVLRVQLLVYCTRSQREPLL